jgi:hypothetical protein
MPARVIGSLLRHPLTLVVAFVSSYFLAQRFN